MAVMGPPVADAAVSQEQRSEFEKAKAAFSSWALENGFSLVAGERYDADGNVIEGALTFDASVNAYSVTPPESTQWSESPDSQAVLLSEGLLEAAIPELRTGAYKDGAFKNLLERLWANTVFSKVRMER
jgi:hypothetical protein